MNIVDHSIDPLIMIDEESSLQSGKLLQEHIQSGADVNEPCTEEGWSGYLLMLAIKYGYQDIALALLLAGADVHRRDDKSWTALHWACVRGLDEVVEALIDRGSQ